MRLILFLVVTSVLAVGCVKEISSEERLDRATSGMGSQRPLPPPDELMRIRCTDVEGDLAKARNVDRPESDRVQSYADLYTGLKQKTQVLQDALARNPDLSYQADAEKIRALRDSCVQQTADVRVEFDRYVRELVEVPIVQEIRGGRAVSVARLDFGALKRAVLVLDPEDREAMLGRVAVAEKRIEAAKGSEGGGKKPR
jgi:hypothetical protein